MSDVTQAEQNLVKKNKWTLLALILLPVISMSAAYIAFFTGVGVPDNTVNNGVLLPTPVHVKTLFESDDHQVVKSILEDKKFRLFIPVGETCAADCEKNLYTTRQVHILLNEKSMRLERYAINLGGVAGERYLASIAERHPLLKITQLSPRQWQSWLAQSGVGLDYNQQHYYLLVDQEGWAIMFYTDQHGNLLLKDLKRLLKFTIDYQD